MWITKEDEGEPPLYWFLVLILICVMVFGALSVVKHSIFHSFTLDLGIMSQVIWNTAHGRLFETSLDRAGNVHLIGSYMGNHVRPIFLLLAPFYRLWPDPRLLLILQSAALALGAVPLYWIARRKLSSLRLQIAVVSSYFLYPALGFINLFDFHPVALSIPFLLTAYWALLEKRDWLFWLMIVLSLMTKEEMVVPIGALGIYCLLHPQWRRKGMLLLVLATIWALLCFVVIIPWANEGQPYRFFSLWAPLVSRGESGGIELWSWDAVYFIAHLFLPLIFFPFLAPGLFAISWPSLAYLLSSSRSALHSVGFHYPAVLIPWLFLATVQGLAMVERRFPHKRAQLAILLLVGTLGANALFNPIVFHWRKGAFSKMQHHEQIRAALALIPPRTGVATMNAFGPHLTNRRYLLSLENYLPPLPADRLQPMEYVLLDLVDCRFYSTPNPRATHSDMVLDILSRQQFRVRYWSGRILLLERGDPSASKLDEVRAYVEDLEATGRPCWP
jgi:uncharacterized membrane protein